jgi:hypothetical protein
MMADKLWEDGNVQVYDNTSGYISIIIKEWEALIKRRDALEMAKAITKRVDDGWIPYPDNKPVENDDFYNITTREGKVNPAFYHKGAFYYSMLSDDHSIDETVIAFRYLPNPYNSKRKAQE